MRIISAVPKVKTAIAVTSQTAPVQLEMKATKTPVTRPQEQLFSTENEAHPATKPATVERIRKALVASRYPVPGNMRGHESGVQLLQSPIFPDCTLVLLLIQKSLDVTIRTKMRLVQEESMPMILSSTMVCF